MKDTFLPQFQGALHDIFIHPILGVLRLVVIAGAASALAADWLHTRAHPQDYLDDLLA